MFTFFSDIYITATVKILTGTNSIQVPIKRYDRYRIDVISDVLHAIPRLSYSSSNLPIIPFTHSCTSTEANSVLSM